MAERSKLPYIDSRYVVFADLKETLFSLRDFDQQSEHITLEGGKLFITRPYADAGNFNGWEGTPHALRRDD